MKTQRSTHNRLTSHARLWSLSANQYPHFQEKPDLQHTNHVHDLLNFYCNQQHEMCWQFKHCCVIWHMHFDMHARVQANVPINSPSEQHLNYLHNAWNLAVELSAHSIITLRWYQCMRVVVFQCMVKCQTVQGWENESLEGSPGNTSKCKSTNMVVCVFNRRYKWICKTMNQAQKCNMIGQKKSEALRTAWTKDCKWASGCCQLRPAYGLSEAHGYVWRHQMLAEYDKAGAGLSLDSVYIIYSYIYTKALCLCVEVSFTK